jgi:hypothetical protein
MRWVWLQKTEPHRPWAALPITCAWASESLLLCSSKFYCCRWCKYSFLVRSVAPWEMHCRPCPSPFLSYSQKEGHAAHRPGRPH